MRREKAFAMKISRGVIVGKEKDTVLESAKVMDRYNIGALLIMRGNKLVGIVSERDVLRRVVAKNLAPSKIRLKEIMTRQVVTGDLRDGLDSIYRVLAEASFRHLPIMDGKKLVGIASKRDILYSLDSMK